jgi:glucose-1-phosphate thymidylyltransferase
MSESIILGENEVVGLVPAAGQGKRIAPLPLSKELFPIGFQVIDGEKTPQPKVVSHYLLEKFRYAGITKAFIVIREGKWDIPVSQ